MAKVSLRVYNREVEGMIEGGKLDEAITHCQHILKTFPMHVETYLLLGKAFLESHRYADAADIFQRTLMAVPDDFVAQVGMSIIRDDEGKLDEAIWHMERAFEVQPSNPAIQGELRRLYGRRDGVEPPKIRLSRDALANMYSQGELFNQAIAEIRAVLAEDMNRPDLQVMLARAYFRAGKKVEAAEMASILLKNYPYCMDALRILVEVLPGTTRSENTQVYRQRLGMLDPYIEFVTDSTFKTDQVADEAVNLEQLDYLKGGTPTSNQPDWASSLGIKLAEEKNAEIIPGWMKSIDTAKQPSDNSTPVLKDGSEKNDEIIPEWMRNSGWQETNGQVQENPGDQSVDGVEEPIAQAEIPDWLKSMAPSEMPADLNNSSPSPLKEQPNPKEDEIPEWFSGLGDAATSSASPGLETAPGDGDELPDWLKEMGKASAEDTAAAFKDEAEQTPGLPGNDSPPSSSTNSNLIQEMEQNRFPADGPAIDKSLLAPEEGNPSSIEEDDMAWPEDLAAKGDAEGDVLQPSSDERSLNLNLQPDQKINEATKQENANLGDDSSEEISLESFNTLFSEVPSPDPLPVEEKPSEVAIPQIPGEGADSKPDTEDDTLDWLKGLAAEQGIDLKEQAENPVEDTEILPEWIQKMNRGSAGPADSSGGEKTEIPGEMKEKADDETITSWLNKKDVKAALDKASHNGDEVSLPGSQEIDLPGWLKEYDQEPTPVKTDDTYEELPEWLKKPEAEKNTADKIERQRITEAEPGSAAWLEENATAAKPPAPTSHEEWIPVDEKTAANPAAAKGLKPTGILSPVPSQDKDAELLALAQEELKANRLNESMQQYGKLIKKGRLLNEVIHDLQEAIYRFPVDVIVWQTLGDAAMRANRLQDALDAYTKAEELIR